MASPRSAKDCSPEYKAIHSNRVDLKDHLSTCLPEVAGLLRQHDILSEGQYKEVMSNGCDTLVDIVLLSLKVEPLEFFVEFLDLMKQCGNRFFKRFLTDTIEADRKRFYRQLFNVGHSTSSQAYDVFMSYSRQSDSTHCTTITSRLSECGLRVFMDEACIKPGDIWPAEVVNAINSCKAFVVLLSKDYVQSLYCNGELCEAEALHKRIFPVVCERGWSEGLAGQPVARMVERMHYAHLEGQGTDRELNRLIDSIKECVSVTVRPSETVARPTDTIDGPVVREVSTLTTFLAQSRLTLSNTQLDRAIETTEIPLVAGCFNSVDMYIDALGLTPAEQTDVRSVCQLSGTTVAMAKCLKVWKSHVVWNATFRTLLNILLGLRREAVAYSVCQYMMKSSAPMDMDSDSEDEPSSMLNKHKDLLTKHTEALCKAMEPSNMINYLRKEELLSEQDQQVILGKGAKEAQNVAILDEITKRGPYAFHKFVCCLKCCGHTELAYSLQPVRYQVLWFASSPALAAAVVHALEEYHGFTFPEITHSKSPIVRRATVFRGWQRIERDDLGDEWCCIDNVEVCLVFPVSSARDIVNSAMSTAFEQCPRPTIAVMSGVCESVSGGEVVIADKAITVTSTLNLDPSTTDTLKRLVESRFIRSSPKWFRSFTATHTIAPQAPSIGSIASGSQTLDCMGYDTDTHKFYQLCRDKLSGRAVYFVCKGVVRCEGAREEQLTYATLSSSVAMEICSGLIDNLPITECQL